MLDANFTFLCDPIDYSNNPKALRVSWVVIANLCTSSLDHCLVGLRVLVILLLQVHRVHRYSVLYPAKEE